MSHEPLTEDKVFMDTRKNGSISYWYQEKDVRSAVELTIKDFQQTKDKAFATIDMLYLKGKAEPTQADVEQLVLDMEEYFQKKMKKNFSGVLMEEKDK